MANITVLCTYYYFPYSAYANLSDARSTFVSLDHLVVSHCNNSLINCFVLELGQKFTSAQHLYLILCIFSAQIPLIAQKIFRAFKNVFIGFQQCFIYFQWISISSSWKYWEFQVLSTYYQFPFCACERVRLGPHLFIRSPGCLLQMVDSEIVSFWSLEYK